MSSSSEHLGIFVSRWLVSGGLSDSIDEVVIPWNSLGIDGVYFDLFAEALRNLAVFVTGLLEAVCWFSLSLCILLSYFR